MISIQMLGAFLLAFVSGTSMTLCFKYLATSSPYVANAVSGLVFGMIGLLCRYILDYKQVGGSFQVHPTMIMLGVSLAGLNVAYSLIYAAGAPTAYVPIIVTGVMTVLLGIAGWWLFGEQLTMKFFLGSLLILGGMIVMIR